MADVEKLLEVEPALEELMQLLEFEPSSAPESDADIPSLRGQLAILVSTGKAKKVIGVLLTHEKRKHLDDKEAQTKALQQVRDLCGRQDQ